MTCVLLVTPAFAGQISLVISGEVDRDSGAMTYAVPDARGAHIDFGFVTTVGPAPYNGERFNLETGDALYVATFVLTPTVEADGTLTVQRRRRGGGFGPERELRGPSRPTIYIPPAGARAPLTVDIYASVDSQPMHDSVWFAPGDAVEWSRQGDAIELGMNEVLVAPGVPVGESFTCQVALRVPSTALGEHRASVRFTARSGMGPLPPLDGPGNIPLTPSRRSPR